MEALGDADVVAGSSIRFSGVHVRYAASANDAGVDAVDGIDLEIAPGEFLALLGPSGCGKTTLLRTVNRLVPLSAGRIEIDGQDIATLDPVMLRRGIGYAIQAIGLFSHMSVGSNIGIVPSLLGWDRTRVNARVDEMLQLVRLDPERYRERRPRQLSGGEAQRVGVARALAAQPHTLLLDEPFGMADAIVRRELQAELRHIVREVGTTTMFVTHDINEALRIADRIAVMNRGRLEQCAPPGEILDAPATPFVQRLVEAR
jgi:osmoprotectant transport system ATP-binding protein